MSRVPGAGWIEHLAGEVAVRAVAIGAKRAIKRGDMHEAEHYAAMLLFGNSSHAHMRCLLPDNFQALGDEFAAASRAAREARR